jgi:hypothetical protein
VPAAGYIPPLPRAFRFPLNLPVRYRAPGDQRWHDARTSNISYSGLLFISGEAIEVSTKLEVVLRFKQIRSDRPTGEAVATGTVVRREERSGAKYAIAVQIDGSTLTMRSVPESDTPTP